MANHFDNHIIRLIEQDPIRREALEHVASLHLPDCYLAAGFVRNLVWDHLHHKTQATPLNDVDVIYFDADESKDDTHLIYEAELTRRMPTLNWQVRNQAKMHQRNGDPTYSNSLDAMSYWPEKETAIAIRQNKKGSYECIAAFGFESLFALKISHNPKRSLAVFEQRVTYKQWRTIWPKLTVVTHSS